jgi:hypothetical protein
MALTYILYIISNVNLGYNFCGAGVKRQVGFFKVYGGNQKYPTRMIGYF